MYDKEEMSSDRDCLDKSFFLDRTVIYNNMKLIFTSQASSKATVIEHALRCSCLALKVVRFVGHRCEIKHTASICAMIPIFLILERSFSSLAGGSDNPCRHAELDIDRKLGPFGLLAALCTR